MDLAGARLVSANLQQASLRLTNLAGADLSSTNVEGASFRSVTLDQTTLADIRNLEGVPFNGSYVGELRGLTASQESSLRRSANRLDLAPKFLPPVMGGGVVMAGLWVVGGFLASFAGFPIATILFVGALWALAAAVGFVLGAVVVGAVWFLPALLLAWSAKGRPSQRFRGPRAGDGGRQVRDWQLEGSRSVGLALALGIVFVPFIFAWLTLRRGYSTLARVVALSYMAALFVASYVTAVAIVSVAVSEANQRQLPRGAAVSSSGRPPAPPEKGLAQSLYEDPRGYFRLLPPATWKTTAYPDDRRGKVAFIGPEPDVDLRVLASDWGVADFDAFLAQMQENAAEAEARMGVEVTMARDKLLGRDVVRRSFTYRGIRMTAFMFPEGGIKHDVQYAAPEAAYPQYEAVVMAAISTYEPLAPSSSEGASKDHALANIRRLATLFLEMDRADLARVYVERGLAIEPGNAELLELQQRVRSR
jgi:hypothetical protein